MKFQKFAALLLVLSMSVATFAACDSQDNDTLPSEDVNEVIDTTKATTAASDETSITLEETTEAPSQEGVFDYGVGGANEFAYNAYLEYIDVIEEANPDTEMKYLFCNTYPVGDSDWTLLAAPVDSSTYTEYFLADGAVNVGTQVTDSLMSFSKDELTSMPVMFYSGYTDAEDYGFTTNVPDGTYYGKIFGVSMDGTKFFAEIAEPVLIPVTEYDGLDHANTIIDINGDPVVLPYKGTLVVSGTYEYGKAMTMFDDDIYFDHLDDGTCILKNTNETVVTYKSRYVVLSVAEDCAISDKFLSLYGKSDDLTLLPNEGDNNVLKSFYYQCMTDDEYMGTFNSKYNDWSSCYGTLSPVVITNGQITDMTIGW